MLAKLTLFGEQNTGKTSTLKYLIYLLLQHNESSIIGMVVSSPGNGKDVYYPISSFTHTLVVNILQQKDCNVTIIIRVSNIEYYVCICTGGDTCERVISNWKFASAKQCKIYGTEKLKEIPESNIFVSACRKKEEVISIEQLKQRNKINDVTGDTNLLYWIRMNADYKYNEVEKLDNSEIENAIFSANNTTIDKMQSMAVATLIEKKIYNLSNLL